MSQTADIEFIDKFGDSRVIRRTRHGMKLKRQSLTPVLTINQQVGRVVGQRIKALRIRRGMELAQLCQRAGLVSATPRQRMWEIENGVRENGVSMGTLYALAIALDVDVVALLPPTAEMAALVDFMTPEPRLTIKAVI